MLLVGDVGGTKTLLEVGVLQSGRWHPAFGARYFAADYPDFHSVLTAFLREWAAQRDSRDEIQAACLGVAGPMFGNRVQMTNLNWIVDGAQISAGFGIPRVQVVNDFAAAASGIAMLQEADLVVLQTGEPVCDAPRLVIGAGTGLGVAYLLRTDSGYQVLAGEGGHAGFAPATLEQLELWRELYTRQGRVTTEDVVSGPGMVRIFEFTERALGRVVASDDVAGRQVTPASIVRGALEDADAASLRTLEIFIACFGEVAGNCALTAMARGGVYVTGGIAPRIVSRLRAGGFLAAFNAKGAHSDAARRFPVSVVTNGRLGLLGCALLAGCGETVQP